MNQPKLTLGSLFDGIGGFCLAGQMAGIKPIWASEIEPFPIRVTEKRFPDIRQLGDIHALHGEDVPPVDIITFGSPCQNLSIAGKRTGLDGEQSSLFYEAVRIIKEMRQSTNGQYPRWAVWENVPGALSSNDGRDFRAVLQSLAEIADESADVPMPADGKWLGAGEIVGNHYSLAWRILSRGQMAQMGTMKLSLSMAVSPFFMQRMAPFPRGTEPLSSSLNGRVSCVPGFAVFLISIG